MRNISAVQRGFAPISYEDAALLASAQLELAGARRAGVRLVGSAEGSRELSAVVAAVLSGELAPVPAVVEGDFVAVSLSGDEDEAVAA
ncbi:hypothetical protein [Amycolatopsis sp. PS_44_ISF1]|uniref:hypothetical protein n=1 Tax=Amycolatopsis sp. PS_44_ISF1 TaxID=2974917 RepID=UPI0028DDA4EC|nr:hypothetical protein [Amycolatopsis sp. PS_44_ISF1]MDT8916240.1 hypothetical protein [Amycolatopsis sp. PS_44_ISF1]